MLSAAPFDGSLAAIGVIVYVFSPPSPYASINKPLQKISEIAQIDKKVTFHKARHSWAVNAFEQEMPISMLSELMGHSSVEITEKVYAQWTQDDKVETVRKLT